MAKKIVRVPLKVAGVPHRFDPEEVSINTGDTVEWISEDEQYHTVTSNDGGFEDGELTEVGASYSCTFEEAGDYPYRCIVHPSMVGVVKVT